MAALSSVGRESLTWVSSLLQKGQRIERLKRRVDREAAAEAADPFAHALLDRAVVVRIARQPVEHFEDHLADLAELGLAEAARRRRRTTEADARRDGGLLRIERDRV